jgi:hypothetical protein
LELRLEQQLEWQLEQRQLELRPEQLLELEQQLELLPKERLEQLQQQLWQLS